MRRGDLGCLPVLVLGFVAASLGLAGEDDWQPAAAPLLTRWAPEVSPRDALPDYPRPQMVRERWLNLNGLWSYAICGRDADRPAEYDGPILVPFAVESALSGVAKSVTPDQVVWYRRTFELPGERGDQRWLLHFGGVDWHATVWINGQQVGEHRGAYDPFTFDITDRLTPAGAQELVVRVWDPTDQGPQPRGKQVLQPGGIFYTAVTGIWQTVWLEPVPPVSIASLKMTPDADHGRLSLTVVTRGDVAGATLRAEALKAQEPVAEALGTPGQPITLTIATPELWSPSRPHLYDLNVQLLRGDAPLDAVRGYFGLRKVAVRRDEDGVQRIFLNNEPLFQYGLLDQGWWPDGLYTAPTDTALRFDILTTRRLGFNMCRKHVKVEPARWYFWCDMLGLLVWQDMPSGDRSIGPRDADLQRTPESAATYRREWAAIMDLLENHPCVVAWVPFNEGWGQFETDEILKWTKTRDPTRLVDGPSGWTDRGRGDLHDLHAYPGPGMFPVEPTRASVLGEFGGLGLPLAGHLWNPEKSWGYRAFETRAALQQRYEELLVALRPLIAKGLAAAVYTQTTDVESEVNGVMTYDRAEIKLDEQRVRNLHRRLHAAPLRYTSVVATSERAGQTWRYSTAAPREAWTQPGFDDAEWSTGPGGFGRAGTPGAVIRTAWHTPDLWLRRTFELSRVPTGETFIALHHDEDVEIYLNGQCVLQRSGYVTGYVDLPLPPEARSLLRVGTNTLAVHCRQTGGGQYIDVGLAELRRRE